MEFAGALIQNALAHSAGDTIAPQKLPEENAPVNVLKKYGMNFPEKPIIRMIV